MKPVIIEENAEQELIGAADFYERRQAGLGQEFARMAREAVGRIQAAPTLHPSQKNETRRYLMERFPFVICYLDLPDFIWVVAFAHTSRKPNYWKDRLRRKP